MSEICKCAMAEAEVLKKDGIDTDLLEPTLKEYSAVKGSLITILQHAQDIYGYLPVELLNYIALRTGIKAAKVLGVATFYAQFRLEPIGKYLIMVCQGTACHVNGSEAVQQALEEELGIRDGQTTSDGLFSIKSVGCLGCCSLSPVMMINGEAYGTLTPDKARGIIADIRAKEAQNK